MGRVELSECIVDNGTHALGGATVAAAVHDYTEHRAPHVLLQVRKLQLMTEKLEQQLNELRNGCDTSAAMSSDQQAYAAGSPFGPAVSGSRSEVLAASPGVDDANTPMSKGTPPAPRHTPPSGVAFLSRTTTQGAAALRRNNKPGFGTPGAVTPPPAVPRSMSSAAVNASVNAGGDDAVTPISAVRASAGGSEGGAPETPGIDVSPLDPELLKLVTQPRSQMDIGFGVRSSLNRVSAGGAGAATAMVLCARAPQNSPWFAVEF